MKPRLTLCMIVKNEEGQLARCLSSVADVVDELVVVDTGSTDGTVALAESYGAKVVHHPWDGSFSSARNISLDHATGDWVLILDADERVAEGAVLRAAVEAAPAEVEAYILPLVNFVGEKAGEEAVTAPSVRLFRNRPEYRFTRALHEQIMLSIQAARPDAVIGFLNAAIEHFGYLNAIVADKDKIRRNLALAEEEVKRYPADAFSWYNLGQEHFRLGQWEEAIAAYQRGFPYLQSLAAGFAPALVKHLTVCLLNSRRPDEALRVTADACVAYPTFTDLWVLRGLACLQQGRQEDAIREFRQALAKGEVSGGFFISDEGVGSFKAHWWIGACQYQLGQFEAASESYRAAIAKMTERGRYLPPPLEGLIQVWQMQKLGPAEILPALAEAVDLANPRWRELAARLLLQHNYPAQAVALLEGLQPLEAETLLALGVVALRHGRADEAVTWWSAVPSDHPARLTAEWHLVLAHAVAQRADLAAARLESAIAARGESELVALYRGLVRLWAGEGEAQVPVPQWGRGQEALRGHLALILDLLLAAEAYPVFERTLPALGWVGLTDVEQAALLGRLYHGANHLDLAFEALVMAVEGGDTTTDTLRLLAMLCLRRGAYLDAEQLFREVLGRQAAAGEAFSPHNTALLGYLSALSAQGKTQEAEPLWQELLTGGRKTGSLTASIA